LVSSSPEQFLQVDPAGLISTKPIKGTRPRGEDAKEDLAIVEELQQNGKERAENLMIVDLMRNDFTKVCESNSVTVPKLFDVETYATVHQLVSTVTGKLRVGFDAISALEAAFPGGSMTGAPKFRAVEIIGELEQGKRGVYSGVAGYLGDNGSADFGMVIRSLVFDAGRITLGVGGGITIDSDPEAELAETKLKAKALLGALKAVHLLR
jgi:anthranilate/para-aminobenzoate synthase component I